MLLPGVSINTSPTDYDPVKQLQLMRFDVKPERYGYFKWRVCAPLKVGVWSFRIPGGYRSDAVQ